MKNLLFLIVFSISSLVISGCSTDKTDEPNKVNSTVNIDGIWDDDGNIIRILNDVMTMQELDLDSTLEVSFSITREGEKTLQVNNVQAQKVYVEMTQYLFTPHLTSKVISLNSKQECGYSNWEVNVTKDVTTCYAHDFLPFRQILFLDKDTLSWGDGNQIGSDSYPDALDSTSVWIRYSGEIEDVIPSLPDEFYSLDDLNGSWDLLGTNVSGWYADTISHTYSNIIRETRVFGWENSIHKEDYYSFSIVGGKDIGPNSHLVKIIERIFLDANVTIQIQADVDDANTVSYCGYTDWEVNQTKSVGYCDQQEPYVDYTIYSIENDVLYFGDETTIGSDGYPDALESNPSWKRK